MLGALKRSIRLRRFLGALPVVGSRYRNWRYRIHPFDREFRTDTSGFLAVDDLAPASLKFPYAGSQPSIVRRILETIPEPKTYEFVDLGCGKGRPSLIASEFPFRALRGIELAPSLVGIAKRNAQVWAQRFPSRQPIEFTHGDALCFEPVGRTVVFNYNGFPQELFSQIVANFERRIETGLAELFVVYYNPVAADVLDRSPHFARWSAECYPYAAEEIGFGSDTTDSVVVWQSLPARHPALRGSERAVRIVTPDWRAEVAP